VVFTLDGLVSYLNPAFTETFGWTLEELEGKSIPYVPPGLEQETLEHIRMLMEKKVILRRESKRLTKDGRVLDVILREVVFSEPGEKKTLEGPRTRLVYLLPEKRTPLEALRNYQQEIKEQGGNILFECSGGECGGDPGRSSSGGGGEMSLAMYLMPQENITDPVFSNGHCAMTDRINDQRYTAAILPASGIHVSVLTYTLKGGSFCKAFNDRTIAIVDLVETREREQKMVTVKADAMDREIAASGSIALYGIYFDFDKAVVKPESKPTLQEIALLLKNKPGLKLLIAGHTDNVGNFAYNTDLSQRRAAAVVQALTGEFGIDRSRLTPVGVSSASPKATNRTEEGRARNRRVELVEN